MVSLKRTLEKHVNPKHHNKIDTIIDFVDDDANVNTLKHDVLKIYKIIHHPTPSVFLDMNAFINHLIQTTPFEFIPTMFNDNDVKNFKDESYAFAKRQYDILKYVKPKTYTLNNIMTITYIGDNNSSISKGTCFNYKSKRPLPIVNYYQSNVTYDRHTI